MASTEPAKTTAAANPEETASASGDGSRLWQIDALRGVMLVLMTLTHVPTRFTGPAGQPLGYVSAAEGFVFLSAFMAGLVYTRRQMKEGVPEMRDAFLKRVLKIYLSQAALLLFLFSAVSVIGLLAEQTAVVNLLRFYLQHPTEAVVGALLLVYNPPLLDILPMYILFMLASSLVLVVGLRRGWTGLMIASVATWFAAQFGLSARIYDAVVAVTGLDIPLGETGAFQIVAWQLVWMIGLWMGARHATGAAAERIPAWLVAAAAAVALVGFVWRHAVGQAPFHGDAFLNMLFDKWQVGPLRLLDLLALIVLAVRFGPAVMRRLPRWRALETLGSASLPVFCAHLVIALLVLAILGEPTAEQPWLVDVALLAASFTLLYAVALVSARLDRRAASVRAAFKAARAARQASRQAARLNGGVRRSLLSRPRSRRR